MRKFAFFILLFVSITNLQGGKVEHYINDRYVVVCNDKSVLDNFDIDADYSVDSEYDYHVFHRLFVPDKGLQQNKFLFHMRESNELTVMLPIPQGTGVIDIERATVFRSGERIDVIANLSFRVSKLSERDALLIKCSDSEVDDLVEMVVTCMPPSNLCDSMESLEILPFDIETVNYETFRIKSSPDQTEKYINVSGGFINGQIYIDLPPCFEMDGIHARGGGTMGFGRGFTVARYSLCYSKVNNHLHFYTTGWDKIIRAIYEEVNELPEEDMALQLVVEGIKDTAESDEEIIVKLIAWIQKNFTMKESVNKKKFWLPQDVRSFLRKKEGDSADCAYLFHKLLEAANISSDIGYVSKKGLCIDCGLLSSIDHAIVRLEIGDRKFWVDPMQAKVEGDLSFSQCEQFSSAVLLRSDTTESVRIK